MSSDFPANLGLGAELAKSSTKAPYPADPGPIMARRAGPAPGVAGWAPPPVAPLEASPTSMQHHRGVCQKIVADIRSEVGNVRGMVSALISALDTSGVLTRNPDAIAEPSPAMPDLPPAESAAGNAWRDHSQELLMLREQVLSLGRIVQLTANSLDA